MWLASIHSVVVFLNLYFLNHFPQCFATNVYGVVCYHAIIFCVSIDIVVSDLKMITGRQTSRETFKVDVVVLSLLCRRVKGKTKTKRTTSIPQKNREKLS